jgi:hypothetical protein
MRASLFLLCFFCAATLHAAGDPPKVDGRVGVVSKGDIGLITAAAKWWLRKMHAQDPTQKTIDTLSLIHIVDRNRAEVHIWARYPKSGWNVEMRLPIRRVNGAWKADDLADIITLATLLDLTNRWSQPLAGVNSTFDFMKQFPLFATLVPASGGSAPSR